MLTGRAAAGGALTPLGRRGIALPLALLALVALTLMVTTLMLTSGSEGATAQAHVDATRSLYDAEAGLAGYAMDHAVAQVPFAAGTQAVLVPGSSRRVAVTAARLNRRTLADGGTYDTWALTAEALRGAVPAGRAVTALVTQRTPVAALGLEVQAAVTVAGGLAVRGEAAPVSGADGCGAGPGLPPVRMADDTARLAREQLAARVLGGRTLASVVAQVPAENTWCWSGDCAFKSGASRANRPRWSGTLSAGDGVAVVDAGGGTVGVSGGSGLLIVTHGGVSLAGSAAFDGIVVVDGAFSLGGSATLNGALASLSADAGSEIDTRGSGRPAVRYDQCKVGAALQAFSQRARTPTTSSTTFGWAEIVR